MSQHKGGRAAILFILVGGLGVGSLAYYVKTTPQAIHVPAEIRTPPKHKSKPVVEEDAKPHRDETKPIQAQTLRLPAFGDDIVDMELAAKETAVPAGQEPMRFLAQKIVDAAHFDGARALGVDVRDHTAVVQYNAAAGKGMGSMEEGAFLRALQIGFGQFGDIDKVTVESDGEPLQSGHVDLSEPLPVVRPGEKAPEDPKPVEP